MPTSRGHRRAVLIVSGRGDRSITTNVPQDVGEKLEALCRQERTTKSALLRRLIEEHVNLEGHR